jgi:phage-related protein
MNVIIFLMFDLIFFTTPSGKSPVEEFINQQDVKAQRKIYRTIGLLRQAGFRLPGNHLKRMAGTDSLWELRVKQSNKNYRFFMAQVGKQFILLLHAITKKRQKTPTQDVLTAEQRLEEYKRYL